MQVYDSLNKHFEKVKGDKKKAATSGESSDVVRSSGRVQYDVDPGVEETKGGS